jgi:Family of unknown function (DUF6925)
METNTETATVAVPSTLSSFIEEYLRSSEHSWSIGISGAIAEFMYDDDEQVEFQINNTQLCVTTPRGAMQIHIRPEIKCIAYEEPSPCIKSWSQGVAFCIPENIARREQNNVLIELGADVYAIRSPACQELLFDLGLESPYLQFCIRTGDDELIETLRNNCGQSIFEPENPVLPAMLQASPARVIISGLGRVEIENKIPATASETPVGPHTHLLPALLKLNKGAKPELPEGYIEAFTLYPEHPLFDKYGAQKPFKQSAHDHFQGLLSELGAPEYCYEKSRVSKNLVKNPDNRELNAADSHWQGLALRISRMQSHFLKR